MHKIKWTNLDFKCSFEATGKEPTKGAEEGSKDRHGDRVQHEWIHLQCSRHTQLKQTITIWTETHQNPIWNTTPQSYLKRITALSHACLKHYKQSYLKHNITVPPETQYSRSTWKPQNAASLSHLKYITIQHYPTWNTSQSHLKHVAFTVLR